jgi:hypothetical protein
MLLPEPIVSPVAKSWLFWLEDYDWPIPWSAEFPHFPSSSFFGKRNLDFVD